MHSLRSQTGISTCLRSMQPVVLPVLFTKTPLQFQLKWRRTEPYQRLRTSVRAVGEGTHYHTNRTKAKTLCIELLPEKARKPYRDTSETATIKAVSFCAAHSINSWLKTSSQCEPAP